MTPTFSSVDLLNKRWHFLCWSTIHVHDTYKWNDTC